MRAALLLVCVWFLVGCRHLISEPYPDFTYGTVPREKLPHAVLEAFGAAHPGATIDSVETAAFRGKVGQYRIWFRPEQGGSASAVFDREGRSVAAPGDFRPVTGATNKRPAVDAGMTLAFAFGSSCPGTTEAGR